MCVQTTVCTTDATTDRARNGTMAAHSSVAVKTRDTTITSAPPGRSKLAGNWIALASIPEGKGTGGRVEGWAGRGGWGDAEGKSARARIFY